MKGTRFTEQQIIEVSKETEARISLRDLSRKYGFSKSSSYKWKAKYGGTCKFNTSLTGSNYRKEIIC